MQNGYLSVEITLRIVDSQPIYSCKKGTYDILESSSKPVLLTIINTITGGADSSYVAKYAYAGTIRLYTGTFVSNDNVTTNVFIITSDDSVTQTTERYPAEQ